MPASPSRRGYTLIELVVTILIIGILTAIAVPQYLRTVETGYADDAVATVNMIGTTNKMFALDHATNYVVGAFPTAAGTACGTNGGVCPAVLTNGCVLVWCKYLADQDWGDKRYTFNACDTAGGGGGNCVNLATGAGSRLASAGAPYNGWGYYVDNTGKISAVGSAPPPTY